ncbi:MAG: hypothetical protein IPG18_11015 [Saprospiraceae bacterium]|nr:hypothetical protein [Saprospiraceae bacterium]MBK6784660.1 hypothetical protein [Saprospiraceae bacterium]MBK8370291.1 hypothetical protein [Saprospiraceae bacterium]MBK8854764.1 hypothetical protein [Saprospiraceae bacterium]MBK9044275.1 hypothetical protein [Saprospiraceae bacterium]
MKPYRILSNEELEILKPEFLKYLVSQGIPAEEWEKWKIADIEKTKLMIESFSEFIYFSILQKTRYVHKVVDQGRQFIRCNDNEFDLIWIQYQESYNDKEDLLSESNREKFEIVKGKKVYSMPKNDEIFGLFLQGFRLVLQKDENFADKLFGVFYV